ncbi:hypothetical protein FGO68_gene17023 [Halteria grandinella]|uniref:TLDc domain-containing protein n=1 Tax=Halteria grandinella TaxID=5974 RepID=A0A8J8NJX4_HALGN|nr:hypothetical protein FGO68_gene17023 [Halteria grandinella]
MFKFIIHTVLLTACTSTYIGNCSNAFTFSEVQAPGTKFTCAKLTTSKVWQCKVTETLFPMCSKEEQCKSFNCQLRMKYFEGSNMGITVEEGQWLLQQIKGIDLSLKPVLLYQATRDGWSIPNYHSKVGGIPNTYNFFKFSQTQRRAGFFTTLPKNISAEWSYQNDNQSFILSIDKRIVGRANQFDNIILQSQGHGPAIFSWLCDYLVGSVYPIRRDGSAHCGIEYCFIPFEDDTKICSLNGLDGADGMLDEIEVWQIQ